MLYARIAPHAHLPIGKDELTYAVTPETLSLASIGQLVTVSVRGRKTWGIITAISRHRPSGIRHIAPIDSALPIQLSPQLLAFARAIRLATWQPLGVCLGSMLPPPKKRFTITEDAPPTQTVPAMHQARTVAVTGDARHRYSQYIDLAKKSLANGRSAILVFAHHAELDAFIDQSTEPVIRWESEVSVGRRWQTWQAVQASPPVIVAGLRTAIFAPVTSLGVVIIDHPQSRGHKADQAPYLASLTAAQLRQAVERCHLVFGDTLPPLSTRRIQSVAGQTHFASIDLITAEPRQRHGLQSMSESWLINNVAADDRCFVFINRLGAGHYRCYDCQSAVRCPTCQSGLLLERTVLHCQQCGWQGAPPVACSTCQSTQLGARGIGTETVAKAASIALHRPATIVDRYHPDWPGSSASLIVGTEFSLPFLGDSPPDWSLIVGLDEARRRPSFDAGERAIRLVADIASFTINRVAIETAEPEDTWITRLRQHSFKHLLDAELADRIKSSYPPANALVAFRGANDALDRLKQALTGKGFTTLGPVLRRDRKTEQLIAKLPPAARRTQLFNALDQAGLLKNVVIELDPPTDSFD